MLVAEGRNTRNKIRMSVIRRHEGGWDHNGTVSSPKCRHRATGSGRPKPPDVTTTLFT